MTAASAGLAFKPMGDRAVRVDFGAASDPGALIRAWCMRLEQGAVPGVVEWVSAYTTVTVHYLPRDTSYRDLVKALAALHPAEDDLRARPPRQLVLPVRYGGERGPDLAFVAERARLSEAEVVARHCARACRVEMIGFAPGFPYLSGMDPALAVPRLDRPRNLVPAGSVGIGGSQTGVYSVATPGGWRIVGRTPVRLFDPLAVPVSLLAAGDALRFRSVDEDAYLEIEARIAEGSYHCEWEPAREHP